MKKVKLVVHFSQKNINQLHDKDSKKKWLKNLQYIDLHISIGSINCYYKILFSFRFASASDDNLAVIWDAKVFYFYC